jgi:hypothetical protein
MSWVLEGKKVRGLYLGSIMIQGMVEESRVAYGGRVLHSVRSDAPPVLPWSVTDSDRLFILEDKNILEVL